ncbi:MAG: hypothetical protein ACKVT1_10110 [Dehalococcoidia bacterium]
MVSPRDRIRERPAHSYDGSKSLYAIMLAAVLLLLVAAISLGQVTTREHATRLLQAGIATLTDVDQVIAENREGLRQLAEAGEGPTVSFPGYPIPVEFRRAEALSGTNEQLRAAVLERSSTQVYEEGLGAFDQTGQQSLGTFSTQGLIRLIVGQLSQKTHDRASLASLVLGVLAGLGGLTVALKNHGYVRLRALGLSALGAAVVGVALVAATRLLATNFWPDDPFGDDLAGIVTKVMEVPLRNYTVLGAAGLVLTVAGLIFQAAAERRAWDDEESWPMQPPIYADDEADA